MINTQNMTHLNQQFPVNLSQGQDLLNQQFIDFDQLQNNNNNNNNNNPIIQQLHQKLQQQNITQQLQKNIQYLYDIGAVIESKEKAQMMEDILNEQSKTSIEFAEKELKELEPNMDNIIKQLNKDNNVLPKQQQLNEEEIIRCAKEIYDEEFYKYKNDISSQEQAKLRLQQCKDQINIKKRQFYLFDQYYYQLIINYQDSIREIKFFTESGQIKVDLKKFCCQKQTVSPQMRYKIQLPDGSQKDFITNIILFDCFHTNSRKTISENIKEFQQPQNRKESDYDDIFDKFQYQELRIIKNLKETEIFKLLLQLNEKNFIDIYKQLIQIPIFMIAAYFGIRVEKQSFVTTQILLSEKIIVSRKFQLNNGRDIRWDIDMIPQQNLFQSQRLKLIIKMEKLLFDNLEKQLYPYFEILKQQNSYISNNYRYKNQICEKNFLSLFKQGMNEQIKLNKVIIFQEKYEPKQFIKKERQCLIDICDIKKTYIQFESLLEKSESEQKLSIKKQLKETAQQIILLIEKILRNYNVSNDVLSGQEETELNRLKKIENEIKQRKEMISQRIKKDLLEEQNKKDKIAYEYRYICIQLQDPELSDSRSNILSSRQIDIVNNILETRRNEWYQKFDEQKLEDLIQKQLNQQQHWECLKIELENKLEFNNFTHDALLQIYRQIVKHIGLVDNQKLVCRLEDSERRFLHFIKKFKEQKLVQLFDSQSLEIFTQQVLDRKTQDFLFDYVQSLRKQNVQFQQPQEQKIQIEEQKIEIVQTQQTVKFNKEAAEKIKSLKCPHGYKNCKDIECAKINCHCSVNNTGNNSLVPLCKQLVMFGICKKQEEGKCIYCHCINKNTIDLMDTITYRQLDTDGAKISEKIKKKRTHLEYQFRNGKIPEWEYKFEISQMIEHYKYQIVPVHLR